MADRWVFAHNNSCQDWVLGLALLRNVHTDLNKASVDPQFKISSPQQHWLLRTHYATALLRMLLPTQYQVTFKASELFYKTLHDTCPNCFRECLFSWNHSHPEQWYPSGAIKLSALRIKFMRRGHRAFSAAVSWLWNLLQMEVRMAIYFSEQCVKPLLKVSFPTASNINKKGKVDEKEKRNVAASGERTRPPEVLYTLLM